MYKFEKIDFNTINRVDFNKYNGDIYNSLIWLKILESADKVKPVIIKIFYQDKEIGYFTGGLINKIGVKIIGSPFKGWTTPYMGFLIEGNYCVEDIIPSFWNYLQAEFHCSYAEICDKKFKEDKLKNNKLRYISSTTYTVDLDRPIEEVFKGFSAHRRQHIKHFEKYGGGIERVKPDDDFLDDFYQMTEDVFGLQGLKPSFSKKKVKEIFNNLPEENLYCAKAFNTNKKCIGMSAVFGYGNSCQTFMIVTDHNEKFDQNAALFWDAMKYWNQKGKKICDLLGKRPYKQGFRPDEPVYYRVILTKYKFLFTFRNIAKNIYWKINRLKFIIKKHNN